MLVSGYNEGAKGLVIDTAKADCRKLEIGTRISATSRLAMPHGSHLIF